MYTTFVCKKAMQGVKFMFVSEHSTLTFLSYREKMMLHTTTLTSITSSKKVFHEEHQKNSEHFNAL